MNKNKIGYEEAIKKTIDNFVENYKLSANNVERLKTDTHAQVYIGCLTGGGSQEQKYLDYYNQRKHETEIK